MKEDAFKIYTDRLKGDDTESVLESAPASIFDIKEKDLILTEKVIVSGQAYLAKNHLILDLKIKATGKMPCSICNALTEFPIEINDFTLTLDLCEIPSAVYDYTEEVRSAILLKIPHFLECSDGHCPNRAEVKKYLKKSESNDSDDTHHPFSDLSL